MDVSKIEIDEDDIKGYDLGSINDTLIGYSFEVKRNEIIIISEKFDFLANVFDINVFLNLECNLSIHNDNYEKGLTNSIEKIVLEKEVIDILKKAITK